MTLREMTHQCQRRHLRHQRRLFLSVFSVYIDTFTFNFIFSDNFIKNRCRRCRQQANNSSNVILVHGGWADGSSWGKVITILKNAGLNVVAVQLPLHTLADDVATVKRAILEQGMSGGSCTCGELRKAARAITLLYDNAFKSSGLLSTQLFVSVSSVTMTQ